MIMFLNPKQIRALRKALGMNSTRFAVELNVTTNSVARWELGDRRPRHDTMAKMNEMMTANGITVAALDRDGDDAAIPVGSPPPSQPSAESGAA